MYMDYLKQIMYAKEDTQGIQIENFSQNPDQTQDLFMQKAP